MAEIAKSTAVGVSLATALPPNSCKIGPELTAGERLYAGDACYIAANGLVMRALESQANAAAAINDVQSMVITNNPGSGTYLLFYPSGQILQPGTEPNEEPAYTPPLAYNSNAAAIQAALQALSTVGSGNLLVTGTYPNFTITGAGAFAGQQLDLVGADPTLMLPANTGGPAPEITITKVTEGQPAGTGVEQGSSRVRGFAMINVGPGQPVTLYTNVLLGYSDQLLVPGTDYYLSGITPGGLTDTAVLSGQRPIAFSLDNTRVYVRASQ
jgi:hypothetical protein